MKYEVEISSSYPQWWRYNLYVMVVGFNAAGEQVGYKSQTDRVYDVSDAAGVRRAPVGYDAHRLLKVESVECEYVEIYLYAVTNTFPDSELIKDSPSFSARMRVSVAGRMVEEKDYVVNQWGGLTVVAHRVHAEAE